MLGLWFRPNMMGSPMASDVDQQSKMLMQAGVWLCLCCEYTIGVVTAKNLKEGICVYISKFYILLGPVEADGHQVEY